MVTRSKAIERMAKAILINWSAKPSPKVFAAVALDALLDYLEENQAHMLMFRGQVRVALGHALVSELVVLLKEEMK